MVEYVELSGGPIEFEWSRKPASALEPTIVLLHEGLGCLELWRDFPAALQQATGMPVLSYSRYGYGRSAPCALPRPLSYMHDEAREVLPELLLSLGVRRHILVGHSDGGSIALIYAGSRKRRGLLGIATMAAHIFAEEFGLKSIADARTAYAKGALDQALRRYHGDNTEYAFRGWADTWLDPKFRDWNLEEFLPKINVPVLVMQGFDDQYGTPLQVKRIAAGIGGRCTTLMLSECGHAPQKDQRDATLQALRGFMAPLTRTS